MSALRKVLSEIRAGLGQGISWLISAGILGYYAYRVVNGEPLSIDTQAALLSVMALIYFALGIGRARKAGRK